MSEARKLCGVPSEREECCRVDSQGLHPGLVCDAPTGHGVRNRVRAWDWERVDVEAEWNRSALKKTFGETFGEARAATVVSGFAAKTGRLRGQRPQLQKIPASETTYQRRSRHCGEPPPPRTRGLSLITGPQMREQNHIADRFRTGQHHDQSIDPEPQPARTWHSMLKSQQKFFI